MTKIEIVQKYSKVFCFKVVPCSAVRMTYRDRIFTNPNHPDPKKRQRPAVTKYFTFKNEILWTAKKIGYTLTPVLNILFIVPMPESWSKKKKTKMLNQPHMQRPDRDNYLKAFQDSFEGDDGFVWDGQTTKIWGEEGEIIVYE
jgi:Holliday junction resolvase RusA-like endonuclease